MRAEQATGKLRLISDGQIVEVEALFDTGASRSVMAADIAKKLSTGYYQLPHGQAYALTTPKGERLRVDAQVRAKVELYGCDVPSTGIEVSPDLVDGRLIIGRPQLDEWDIVFTKAGPRPKSCPIKLELV